MSPIAKPLWLLGTVASCVVGTYLAFALARPCRISDIVALLTGSLAAWPALGYLLYLRFGCSRTLPASLWRAVLLAFGLWATVNILLSNLVGAVPRAKQVRAVAQLRALSGSLDSQRANHALNTGSHLGPLDPWGHPLRIIVTSPDHYFLISYGECGDPDVASPLAYGPSTPTTDSAADIVVSDGVFIRYPEGVHR
jgi:hypothetical protein